MLLFFIAIQFVLLAFMLFHDWISIPPLNDIEALKTNDSTFYRVLGSLINGLFVLIPLILTIIFFDHNHVPFSIALIVFSFYFVLTLGTIFSWWLPYIFGSSKTLKEAFSKFKNTHHFLPARGDNIVPNTLHVILHIQVWICLAISIYYLILPM